MSTDRNARARSSAAPATMTAATTARAAERCPNTCSSCQVSMASEQHAGDTLVKLLETARWQNPERALSYRCLQGHGPSPRLRRGARHQVACESGTHGVY